MCYAIIDYAPDSVESVDQCYGAQTVLAPQLQSDSARVRNLTPQL